VKIDYRWTGNFLLTLSMPQFGRLDNNIYYMQGYSGHGVTCTHLAGRLISSCCAGRRATPLPTCRTTRSRAAQPAHSVYRNGRGVLQLARPPRREPLRRWTTAAVR
jgi:hypothetical protein